MSDSPIQTTLTLLIKVGLEIKDRLDALDQAAEDLQLLNTNLKLLLTVFENPLHEDIIKAHNSEFINILDILEGIAKSCAKCAAALDINLGGEVNTTRNIEAFGKKIVRRLWTFNKIPALLAEIQRKAEHLQKVYSVVSLVILQDIKSQRGQINETQVVRSQTVLGESTKHQTSLELDLSTNFAGIDLMVKSLMDECKSLRQKLQDAIISPNTLAIKHFEQQNPEGTSFWKDRFQKEELKASTLRYEILYVSWARFIHEVETSFILSNIPTGVFERGNIDIVRKRGSRYYVDPRGVRHLSTIRPLWLPSLQQLLDPLHRGYVKPQDYFNLLQNSSLSETLRKLVLKSAGYGTLVECEREPCDLPFPASIESPTDHVGWVSAQIVAIPTPEELGIITEEKIMRSKGDNIFACFNDTTKDVYVYVRYLQTGQIECKSLLRQTRPVGGISIGATLSIRYELESGGYIWSSDSQITEFEASHGGQYTITAGVGPDAVVFHASPVRRSFDKLLRDDSDASISDTPRFDYNLLGPSKTFSSPPQVGEKIQVEHDGYWHDSRVTLVDDEEIEFVDWDESPEQVQMDDTSERGDSENEDENSVGGFFSEEQLAQIGKGTRRLWRPWRRNITRYDVRPYRCLHIGDSIEAPVMYPDFRLHYHTINDSQLYLPARIAGIHTDQLVIEFSPALSAHKWWPGRVAKGTLVELVPGSGIKVENPYDFNRVTLDMDLVRPLSTGPRPALGVQSAKPAGWSSFQGVRLSNLEDLLEQSIWDDSSRKH